MTKTKTALDTLKVSLTAAIQSWMDKITASDEWENLNLWVGLDTAAFMADGAHAVLAAMVHSQDVYREENPETDGD